MATIDKLADGTFHNVYEGQGNYRQDLTGRACKGMRSPISSYQMYEFTDRPSLSFEERENPAKLKQIGLATAREAVKS